MTTYWLRGLGFAVLASLLATGGAWSMQDDAPVEEADAAAPADPAPLVDTTPEPTDAAEPVKLTLEETLKADRERPVASLLPGTAILIFQDYGARSNQAAWEQTAAYASWHQSGLDEVVNGFLDRLKGEVPANIQPFLALGKVLSDEGYIATVAMPEGDAPPIPHVVVVFPKAGEYAATIATTLEKQGDDELSLNKTTVGPRPAWSITIPNTPGLEVGWVAVGDHLLVAAGLGGLNWAGAVLDGHRPNLADNAHWQRYEVTDLPQADHRTALALFDMALLKDRVGNINIPLPPGGPANTPLADLFNALGVGNVDHLVCTNAYRGKAQWSDFSVVTTGDRTGLMSLLDCPEMTLADLPKLPFANDGFYAQTLSLDQHYSALVESAGELLQFAQADGADKVAQAISHWEGELGIDFKADLLEPIGNVACLYNDSRQSPFGFGMTLAIRVDDAPRLRTTINKLLDKALQLIPPGTVQVVRSNHRGNELISLAPVQTTLGTTFAVGDQWLVVSGQPQMVDAFFLRQVGDLAAWTPTGLHQEAFAELPPRFKSISVTDPRKMVRGLASLLPYATAFAQVGTSAVGQAGSMPGGEMEGVDGAESLRQMLARFPIADLPPAELVARPLFPNIAVSVVTPEGSRTLSRSSVPAIPVIGSTDGASVGVVAVTTALLLPAVQQARQAARRTQSKNNLKQIALALHNLHDTYGHFPTGTIVLPETEPADRLSWLVTALPYIDQYELYNKFDVQAGLDSEVHAAFIEYPVSVLENPLLPDSDPGLTSYVGMAGLGVEGPTLRPNQPKAGAFAYDHPRRINDFIDGTSNTLLTGEVSGQRGPWVQGGPATIRPFIEQPYIDGADGFGNGTGEGAHFGLADGAVRFISKDVDPTVLEALSTIAGGEVVGYDY